MSIEEGPVLSSWGSVVSEMRRVIAVSPEAFAPATIQNAESFVGACRNRIQCPAEVAKGYWSTICVSWDGLQVEIFDDRYELYEFQDGAIAIEYFDISTTEDVPEKLMERLPCLKIES